MVILNDAHVKSNLFWIAEYLVFQEKVSIGLVVLYAKTQMESRLLILSLLATVEAKIIFVN